MFYSKETKSILRFGDVLTGFILTSTNINELLIGKNKIGYNINVSYPSYSAVMSPCCSIERNVISLTPLIPILPSFFDNPYFEGDLTNINRKMYPQQSVPPHIWEKLGEEERQRRHAEGFGYAFTDLFIYEFSDVLQKYIINHKIKKNIETGFYMIDFKNITKVNCGLIKDPKPIQAPSGSKCLELSIEARGELREKISDYFGRVPKEDEIMED